ncbi:MAG: SMP-30/gluconolactonase/LRE family protein [Bryobacteraceae bacterium]|jgi:gluconolactonase
MIFAKNLSAPEGPVALPDGSWLVVEGGADRGCITQIASDGRSNRIIARTGRPNGLAVDRQGFIWAAESKTPSLIRVSMAGKVEVVATGCEGEPFLFPNDLCFGPDGALYMTDSGVLIHEFAPNNQIRPDYESVPIDGRVYRIDPRSGQVRKIDSGIRFTNGIAFGPDRRLYVNETVTGMVYLYEWKDGGITGPREDFGNVVRPDAPPGWKGPDGMAFGTDGKLYVAVFGQGDVTALGADGAVVGRIRTSGMLPTNVAFALPGSRRIHVTEYEHGAMETFEVATDGLALWQG